VLELGEVELLVANELDNAAGGADDNLGLVVLERVDVLRLGLATVEDGGTDGEVLGETLELSVDLVGELARVGHDEDLDVVLGLLVAEVELLERRDHKHGCLTHATLGLAEHVGTEDGDGDGLLLDCFNRGGFLWGGEDERRAKIFLMSLFGRRGGGGHTFGRMLKAAVGDGLHELGTQEEVAEAGGVDADVRALLGLLCGSHGGRGCVGDRLHVVVEKVFAICHLLFFLPEGRVSKISPNCGAKFRKQIKRRRGPLEQPARCPVCRKNEQHRQKRLCN